MALSVRQDDSLLWNRLGATLANGNKSEEAVIAYRRALEISPGFLRSRYNLAISLIHFNLYDEAARQLIQILNSQAAGKGSNEMPAVRSRSITSSSIWNTLRTVATLMNRPELYPVIDGRQLAKCNKMLATSGQGPTFSD
jgi:peroxin-5